MYLAIRTSTFLRKLLQHSLDAIESSGNIPHFRARGLLNEVARD